MKINLIENALNLIFPISCGFCGEIGDSYICKYCLDYLNDNKIDGAKEYEDKFFYKHFWLFEYKDEVREKIIEYKFNDKSYLYKTFAKIILENKKAIEYIQLFDIIIPVPIHKNRKKYRGYNQCELIINEVGKYLNIKVRNDIIMKIKNIKPQSTLSKDGRADNIKGVYKLIINEDLSNKNVLIFDDVFTTASTVNECARIIKMLNCKNIGVITLAKD